MFVDVQIDSYFAHLLIFAQSIARKKAFFAPLLFSRKRGAKINGIIVVYVFLHILIKDLILIAIGY